MDYTDPIQYDTWLEEALRGVVCRALEHARDFGLDGDHHFYISFETQHKAVVMPDHLRALHPTDMTIVLQHQFEELDVEEESFSVTLRFSGRPVRLTVPYEAISTFTDPSVNFGLQLRMGDELDGLDADLDSIDDITIVDVDTVGQNDEPNDSAKAPDAEQGSAEVIALDAFRKK